MTQSYFDLILVPQGAELQAVQRGLRKTSHPPDRRPPLFPLPIGPQATQQRLQTYLTSEVRHIKRAIVLGLAGSLVPRYGVGAGVIYQEVCSGPPSPDRIPCDPDLVLHLSQRLPEIETVLAWTSDRIIGSPAEKAALAQTTGAAVVDMEGMAVAQLLRDYGIPGAMVRVVSDDCRTALPDLTPGIRADGSLDPGGLIRVLIREPIATFYLIRGSIQALQQLEQLTTRIFA